jgi:hypothetical protein
MLQLFPSSPERECACYHLMAMTSPIVCFVSRISSKVKSGLLNFGRLPWPFLSLSDKFILQIVSGP